MRYKLALLLMLPGFAVVTGCLPAEAPKKPDTMVEAVMPEEGPSTGENASGTAEAPEMTTESTDDGQTQVSFNIADNPLANAVVQVEKREGGGFIVRGNMGLSGVIRRLGNQWRLDAKFRFPTADYTVGEPTVMGLGTMRFDEAGATLETPENQYLITIPVALPPTEGVHAEVVDEQPISLEIDAPEDANFMITLSQL